MTAQSTLIQLLMLILDANSPDILGGKTGSLFFLNTPHWSQTEQHFTAHVTSSHGTLAVEKHCLQTCFHRWSASFWRRAVILHLQGCKYCPVAGNSGVKWQMSAVETDRDGFLQSPTRNGISASGGTAMFWLQFFCGCCWRAGAETGRLSLCSHLVNYSDLQRVPL